MDSFILPMMLGSIGELRPLQFQTPDKHYGASITLIARRSTQRIGTRHWRRGADAQVPPSSCCYRLFCLQLCMPPALASLSFSCTRLYLALQLILRLSRTTIPPCPSHRAIGTCRRIHIQVLSHWHASLMHIRHFRHIPDQSMLLCCRVL